MRTGVVVVVALLVGSAIGVGGGYLIWGRSGSDCPEAQRIYRDSMDDAARKMRGGLDLEPGPERRQVLMQVGSDVGRLSAVVDQNPGCFTVKERADATTIHEQIDRLIEQQ